MPRSAAASRAGPTLSELSARLASGRSSAEELVEQALGRIADEAGEGPRAFVSVSAESARATARHVDRLRALGVRLPAFAGIPVSIKDLFDIAGEITRSGSRVLSDAEPAAADAPAVARLRQAGFVVIGRTNMTEFAFSGLGVNPHYGTPLNPWDRQARRIPGGSSSGAAVSVTDGMAAAALGTDTGGSCRIPAAFTGIAGFKPTARRVPLAGAFPLSPSLDSVGVLARSVSCCFSLDGIVAGSPEEELRPLPLKGLRFAVPATLVLDGMDAVVGQRFDSALRRLEAAGVRLQEIAFSQLGEIAAMNAKGGFPAAESYAVHRRLLDAHEGRYDPRVAKRILRGREQSAADYIELQQARNDLIARAAAATAPFDAIVFPTVPVVAPRLDEVEAEDDYTRINLLVLRNSTVANVLDRCAISLPDGKSGEAPVGITLMGESGGDRRLFQIARAAEQILSDNA